MICNFYQHEKLKITPGSDECSKEERRYDEIELLKKTVSTVSENKA